jgi:hypothetical protein
MSITVLICKWFFRSCICVILLEIALFGTCVDSDRENWRSIGKLGWHGWFTSFDSPHLKTGRRPISRIH